MSEADKFVERYRNGYGDISVAIQHLKARAKAEAQRDATWETFGRTVRKVEAERDVTQSTIAKVEARLTNPTEKEIEAVGQAIRAELRPEHKDSGPLYLDHDAHEYESLARAAISALGSVPSTGEGNE